MIDYEIDIFNEVYPAVAPLCAPNRFLSEQITNITTLPTACLWELGNDTERRKQSSSRTEDFALLTYQLDVYAQTKAECRKIFKAADTVMIRLNFMRISGTYLPTPDNTQVARYTARYQAVSDPNGVLYRRG